MLDTDDPEVDHAIDILTRHGRSLRRALHFDDGAAARSDEVQVDLRARIFEVHEIERELVRAVVEVPNANRRDGLAEARAFELAGLRELVERETKRDKPSRDRRGARTAVGFEDVAVDRYLPFSEPLHVDRGAKGAPDEALNFLRSPAGRFSSAVAIFARLRIRSRVHLVLGRDPAFAFALHPRRDLLVDRRCRENDRGPGSVKHGAFGHALKTNRHFDGAKRVKRATIRTCHGPCLPGFALGDLRACPSDTWTHPRVHCAVALSHDTVSQFAPSHFESYRGTRYRAEEQAIELRCLALEDRPVVVAIYALLRELEALVSSDADVDDPGPLSAFVARHDIHTLLHQIRRLGGQFQQDEHIAEALHDIRGGALSALFVQLSSVGRVPYRSQISRALFLATRDHMKMMRSVVKDLDVVARERDLAFRPHSLFELTRALRDFTARVGDERVVVNVECATEGVIAESCVECAAIDRVAYNLLNNAVRYADSPSISAWLVTLENDLRVAIANSISSEQSAVVCEQLASNASSLFGNFSSTGSGYGLRIVSELVGRAYGIANVETLTKNGYVGAVVVEDKFLTWFHWPLVGA